MDNKFKQSNFTPKKPVVIAGISSRKKGPGGFLYIFGVIVFFLVLGLSVGVFFYQQVVLAENQRNKEILEEEISAFDPQLARTFTVLKNRVEAGTKILDNHLAVSKFLHLLEEITVRNVQFSDFVFSAAPGAGVNVSMRGKASSFNTLAFQADIFEQNQYVVSAEFSNINLDQEGNVVFDLEASVDSNLVRFKSLLEEGSFNVNTVDASSSDSEQDEAVLTSDETEGESGE